MDATGPLGHSPASFGWGPPKSDPSRLACEILFSRAAGVNTPAPSMNSFYKRNQLLPPPTTASLRNTCLNLPNRLILFFFSLPLFIPLPLAMREEQVVEFQNRAIAQHRQAQAATLTPKEREDPPNNGRKRPISQKWQKGQLSPRRMKAPFPFLHLA